LLISKTGIAGTMESSDVMITLEPAETIEIDLNSTVDKQVGKAIRGVRTEPLEELGVSAARVVAVDKGALDCAIRARVRAAAYRAAESTDYVWGDAK
jgi:citrate lyase subunit gamma (acyl carrier protein)